MKYIVAEVDGGYTKVLKEANSLFELSKMDIEPGFFPSVFVSKDDIRAALTGGSVDDMENIDPKIDKKIEALTDNEMREICSDMQDAYVESGYWVDLEIICEDIETSDGDE